MKKETLLVVIPFIILIIQQALLTYTDGKIYSLISYFDEIYVLLLWAVILVKNRGKMRIKNKDKTILMLTVVFVMIGLCSNIITGYQSIRWALVDAFTCSKFVLCYLGIRMYLSRENVCIDVVTKLYKFSRIYICCLFVLGIINIFVDIFPKPDYRYFMYSIRLFYFHPTYLAIAAISCVCVIIVKDSIFNTKTDKWFILMGLIVACMTLRTKAIAGALCIILLYCYFIQLRFKNKLVLGCLSFLTALMIGYDQLTFYFGGYSKYDSGFIRERLLIDSIAIASKHIPFGTGFGTFASFVAQKNWSPLYDLYHYVPGPFLSDSFWPIIVAQNGYMGLLIFLLILWSYLKNIWGLQKKNLYLMWAGLSIILYELISSFGESAFFNPAVCPLFILLGIIMTLGTGAPKDIRNS